MQVHVAGSRWLVSLALDVFFLSASAPEFMRVLVLHCSAETAVLAVSSTDSVVCSWTMSHGLLRRPNPLGPRLLLMLLLLFVVVELGASALLL